MKVERQPDSVGCSISLGQIPAQAALMLPGDKAALARAISQQVANVICGDYSSASEPMAASIEAMQLGLAWSSSVIVADGQLIVLLMNGIIHFEFYNDNRVNSDDDHNDDDPNSPDPARRPRNLRAPSEFIEMVSKDLVERAFASTPPDSVTRNRLLQAFASLLTVQTPASSSQQQDQSVSPEREEMTVSTRGASLFLVDFEAADFEAPAFETFGVTLGIRPASHVNELLRSLRDIRHEKTDAIHLIAQRLESSLKTPSATGIGAIEPRLRWCVKLREKLDELSPNSQRKQLPDGCLASRPLGDIERRDLQESCHHDLWRPHTQMLSQLIPYVLAGAGNIPGRQNTGEPLT